MGAGVAGLQAIATARRLGAIVTATDVRPGRERAGGNRFGAKFIAVEDDEFKQAETSGGYAKEMSDAYKAKQAELVADHLKNQDVVVTTALIPGPPSAHADQQGNGRNHAPGRNHRRSCRRAGRKLRADQAGQGCRKVRRHDHGTPEPARRCSGQRFFTLRPQPFIAFIEPMIDKEKKKVAVDWDDEIVAGTLIAKSGALVHTRR